MSNTMKLDISKMDYWQDKVQYIIIMEISIYKDIFFRREEGEFNKGDLITGTKYYNNG